jgi:ABC-type Fe3+/spermidine/putrescine transport system ATPase subunit
VSILLLRSIQKNFAEKPVLKNISFELNETETLAILGPSGCGKSTLLNVIAGLEQPDQGEIFWNNVIINQIPTHQRRFGLMFQEFALFPHLNVMENVAFGLKLSKHNPGRIRTRVDEVLSLVGLQGYEHRDIQTLSGGEAQRVALARALAQEPELLMLDEPLGSLDRTLRERLINDLRRLLRKMELPTLYVTHDQDEAFTLAHRIIIMNNGKIEQLGTPQAIYQHPANVFVARFLGFQNILKGKVENGVLFTTIGTFPLPGAIPGTHQLLIHPDQVILGDQGVFVFTGKVLERIFRGLSCRVLLDVQGTPLSFDFPPQACVPVEGEMAVLSFNPEQAVQLF